MIGNVVFGWLQLAETVAGYAAKRADGTYDRLKIIELGRAAAAALRPLLAGQDALTNQHANTTIPEIQGAAPPP